MENKMAEVAKLLGVELEEEFRIEGFSITYKLSEKGLMRWEDNSQKWYISYRIGELLTGEKKIIKLLKAILDEKEKEYLSAVIKPFRDKVISIANYYEESIDNNFIEIEVKNYCNENQYVSLPFFKKGTMYKGMEENKKYTLEELGLQEAQHGK